LPNYDSDEADKGFDRYMTDYEIHEATKVDKEHVTDPTSTSLKEK
jgi:hypothetical protein